MSDGTALGAPWREIVAHCGGKTAGRSGKWPGLRQKRAPAASATRRAYGWLVSSDVLHQTYLPFTADQLRQHFAPVAGPGERDRHLQYYLASINEAREYAALVRRGERPTRAQTRGWAGKWRKTNGSGWSRL